jgi:rhodanese-related sulfurtransferase
MTPDALAALLASAEPHALLDLRERAAYEAGQIYRATSLPRRLLEFRLPALVTARRTPIVLCDEDGALSELAAPTVAGMGYADVRILEGGLRAWRASGRLLVRGINVPSKAFGERVFHGCGTPQIPPHELHRRMERGEDLVIVDTRTPEEYARGCIPGAWSVPGGELVLRIGELVRDPRTTIVVHCGGRTRGYIGTESLRRMGLPNQVVALENGTMGWELAGFSLERGASRWMPPPSEESRRRARIVAERVAREDGIPSISPGALRALWERRGEEDVNILDVRAREEYEAGHVAGAVWAPGGQAVQATDEYIAVRAAQVVTVCDGWGRSVMTASWLKRMGVRVAVLEGGFGAWEAAGGAVERGHPAPAPWGFEGARAMVPPVAPALLSSSLPWPARPMVLDVSESDGYAAGHVPGAGWLCRSRLEWVIERVEPDRRRPLVLACRDGLQSTLAAAALVRLGYERVGVLDGGTAAWEAAGLALERGKTLMLDEADDVVLKPYDKGREAMEAYLKWEMDLDADALDARRPA